MAHNPLDHVLEQYRFPIAEEFGVTLNLPWGLTNYMVLEVVAAGLILGLFVPLAQRVGGGEPARGTLWNALESLLGFIRDNVAKPALHDDADRFVPFLWTLFLFILFCNLLGMIPFLGSPTASIAVTTALALIAFFVIHISAVTRLGPASYVKAFVPPVDFGNPVLNVVMGIPLKAFLFVLEVFGAVMRGVVLALRLFANLFAGHTLLAVMILFIPMFIEVFRFSDLTFWPSALMTVVIVTALSLLELLVAFIQAFVFTLLTTLFLGMALHPHH